MEEKERGKIIFEIKHPFWKDPNGKFFLPFLIWGISSIFLLYSIFLIISNIKSNDDFNDDILGSFICFIVLFILSYYFFNLDKSIPFRIYEKGILFPDLIPNAIINPEKTYIPFNEINTIYPQISFPKGNIVLWIKSPDLEGTIEQNCLERGLPYIKKNLKEKWNSLYNKYNLVFKIRDEDWNFIRKILRKEPLSDIELDYFGLGRPHIAKKMSKKKAFEVLIFSLKYTLDTGKKIIPDDIEVPEELNEIAKKIDLDL